MNSILREACFACTTPYQVMGAISIVTEGQIDADIYIFGMFEGYREIADRLREEEIFTNIYAVDASLFKAPGRKGALLQMVKCKETVSTFLPAEVSYKTIYSSSRAHIKNLLLHELIKRNKDLKIIVYDDGLGMYAKDSHVLNTTRARRSAERLFGWDLYIPARISFMVNIPALFEKPNELQQCDVQQMPCLQWNDENRKLLMRVFGAAEEDLIQEKVVVFDSLRGFDHVRDEKMIQLDKCFSMANHYFGSEHTIMKPHPRSKKTTTASINVYQKTGVPMEVLYAGMDHLDERILITYASSAVYTPKMYFNAEPWVINLFRIVDNQDGQESEWEITYQKFKKIYNRPEKVIAPRTIEEYEACLKELMN